MTFDEWKYVASIAVPLLTLLLGYALAQGAETRKWKRQKDADDLQWTREHGARYNQQRISAYASFLEAANNLALKGWTLRAENKDDDFTTLLGAYFHAYHTAYILASDPVRNELHGVNHAIGKASPMAGGTPPIHAEDNDARLNLLLHHTDRFQDCARRERGIEAGLSPTLASAKTRPNEPGDEWATGPGVCQHPPLAVS